MEDQTGMQPAAPQAAPAVPVVKQVKELLSQDKIKEKFGEVLEKENPNYDPENEEGTEQPTIKELKPVPFSMDRCELRLWEREV